MSVSTVDYHTAGEPFRIVTGGVDPLPGRTILDKRRHALEHVDDVRRLLVNEPRGHADMYGCFVTEPEDDGADLGVVFFHNAGYSTACGHGTIALVTWAIESGVVDAVEPETRVVVDCPSGRLETVARVEDGDVKAVRFRNVPAYVHARGLEAAGRTVDVAFGGAFYAFLEERVAPERAAAPDRARPRRSRPTSSESTRSSIRWSRSCATSTASSSGSTRKTGRRRCSETSRCSPTARSTARRAAAPRRRGWRCSTCPSSAI